MQLPFYTGEEAETQKVQDVDTGHGAIWVDTQDGVSPVHVSDVFSQVVIQVHKKFLENARILSRCWVLFERDSYHETVGTELPREIK